jgi:phage terminase large subunit-like protein
MAIVGDGPRIKWLHWYPEESAAETEAKRSIPLRRWAEQGWVTLIPGRTTDYNVIRKDINELAVSGVGIREIAVDRNFQGFQVINDLVADGFEAFAFPQSFMAMSAPSKRLEELILSRDIIQDGNPVTRWMVDNVTTKTDAQGNLMPDREKSHDKIDGVVAAIMAISRFMVHETDDSVYDTQGIEAF